MLFNNHSNLKGLHAIFNPSQSAWLRYDDEKALEVHSNREAAKMGTRLHEFAAEAIELGIKLPRNGKTLNAYINDAIGFKMSTEVVLVHSERFFGTADAISFNGGVLRIHDLKTGKSGKIEDHMEQLEIYAALFCLEYKIKPVDIRFELRVYKCDEVLVHKPEPETIIEIMNKIVHLNKLLDKAEYEGV